MDDSAPDHPVTESKLHVKSNYTVDNYNTSGQQYSQYSHHKLIYPCLCYLSELTKVSCFENC
uniref:Putative ovule protein n=1 Tax=Solanum chacoense TaxID=4108 RepID=A0A0V0GZQ4_SOLCH